MNLAVFFHCLVFMGRPPKLALSGVEVIQEQMTVIEESGLLDTVNHLEIGINGGEESRVYASILFPKKAKITFHGLDSYNENSTIRLLEQWLPGHPGWAVLYAHSKGATWPYNDPFRSAWRNCMTNHCVWNWRRCVHDLETGYYDAVGCHFFRPPITPPSQHIFGGNVWWSKSDFLITLPSIMKRARIITSGLKHPDSRFEAEVWIGNGPRVPRVRDYHPGWRQDRNH